MARIWKELPTGASYGDKPLPVPHDAAVGLEPRELICAHVCSYTFRFTDAEEIREYITFFEKHNSPSGPAAGTAPNTRWHAQPWYEHLPPYLLEESTREKVLKALREALTMAETVTR
jgi:hypothetical protein